MNLATEIIKFFHVNLSNQTSSQPIRTIEDFSKLKPEWYDSLDLRSVFKICTQLEHHGYLMEAATQFNHPIMGRSYIAPTFDERKANYGEYEFIGHGFGLIREKLGPAVLPVVITKPDDKEDIGTCFLVGNKCTLITARHVIEGMKCIKIPDHEGRPIKVREIIVPRNPHLDVALILADTLLTNLPCFQCSDSSILDEVLCLGFPPIPGFESMLIADLATVNSEIKASAGRIVASNNSYLDQQKYFLINARVKGGNSGGPIINRQGYVVGIIVQASMSSDDLQNLDSLGYGVVTPKSEWINLFIDSESGSHGGVALPFQNLPNGGFRTDI